MATTMTPPTVAIGRPEPTAIPEYERAVHFRLGWLKGAKGPGLIPVLPVLDRIVRISLRIVALIIPGQERVAIYHEMALAL